MKAKGISLFVVFVMVNGRHSARMDLFTDPRLEYSTFTLIGQKRKFNRRCV